MSDEECPLSELPASQCACRKHRGGDDLHEVETTGRSFDALYAGCCERCERAIVPDQSIVRVTAGGYAHERCPR